MRVPAVAAPRAPDVLLFSWNVDGSIDAINLACSYLAGAGDFIAAFQEVPREVDSAYLSSAAGGKLVVAHTLLFEIANKKLDDPDRYRQVVLACSATFTASAQKAWDDARMVGATFTHAAGAFGALKALAIHAPSRGSSQGARRIARAIVARGYVDDYLAGSRGIVMGDFNANPYEAEMCSPECFFALRNGDELDVKRAKQPLYNPFWHWLAEKPAGGRARGTLYYPSDDSEFPWQCYDQILLSADLAENAGEPIIRCDLPRGGEPQLLTKKHDDARPKGKPYSDHLPIELGLRLSDGDDP
jgi:endonuclease/exonuclease/phosphatase family metal-dependent hydrolase